MLEKLFTSKNRIKILCFLFFQKQDTYLREISKELKVSSSAVKRELDNLILIGLIKKNKNKIELNKKSDILNDLKNIFIKTDYLSYPIKKAVNKNQKIKFALIFGSFARNECEIESDIDLLVIGEIKLSEVIKLLKPIEDKIGKEINPVVWTIENLKKQKNSGFIKDIFKKGIILLKGDENEIQRTIG